MKSIVIYGSEVWPLKKATGIALRATKGNFSDGQAEDTEDTITIPSGTNSSGLYKEYR